jgi:hypothetical protein
VLIYVAQVPRDGGGGRRGLVGGMCHAGMSSLLWKVPANKRNKGAQHTKAMTKTVNKPVNDTQKL